MSETVSASAGQTAPASPSPASSIPAASAPASGGVAPVNSGANSFEASNNTPAAQGAEPGTPRKLGGADLDALVEIQVNGEKREMPLKEAIKIRQLQDASYQKMNEAAQIRRQSENLMQLFKSDPDQFAKVTGIDLDTFSEERLARKYEIQQMSPEQRELMESKRQVEQYKKMDLQSKQSLLDEIKDLTGETVPPEVVANIPKERMMKYLADKKAEVMQHQTNFEGEFLGAWKETGLPADPIFGQWVAAMMLNHQRQLNSGKMQGEPLQAKEAAAKVNQKYEKTTNNVADKYAEARNFEGLQRLIGKKAIDFILQHNVDRVNRANDPLFGNREKSPGANQPASEKKTLNHMEWRAQMGIS